MRTILFTGKGGVGKTSIASATALRCANLGHRTLVVSTDPAHSLSDSFNLDIGKDPVKVADNLHAEEIDPQQKIEENWGLIKDYMTRLFDWKGINAVEAEELAVLPGMEELFSLLEVKKWEEQGAFDVVILDCAPTGSTLRLLSFPEIMDWYMQKLFNIERKAAKILRPVASKLTSLPLPEDNIFSSVELLYDNLAKMKDILADSSKSSVRLVLNPEKMVIAESRRAFTYLSLFGYPIDSIIVNRLMSDEVTDPFFARWKEAQEQHLENIRNSFFSLPILTAHLFSQEVYGTELLDKLSRDVYGDRDPAELFYQGTPIEIGKQNSTYFVLLSLPFSSKEDVDVRKKKNDLIIKIGQYKRNLMLPLALANKEPSRARFDGAKLRIEFEGV
ncbi:MAG: ArsA family ATPase [Terriglobia bacterium]